MSKPDLSKMTDLLNQITMTKIGLPKNSSTITKKDLNHNNRPQPKLSKTSLRSTEKSLVPGRTRTSARGK